MQKAILFFLFLIVAFGTCALVFLIASKKTTPAPGTPRPVTTTPISTEKPIEPDSFRTPDRQSRIPAESVPPSSSENAPIAPPRTEQQREQDSVESRRAAFYRQVREQTGDAIVSLKPKEEDRSTLDVIRSEDNPRNTTPLIDLIVRAGAFRNGFRHIRIMAPNPAGALERVRLEAEANSNDDGNWFSFRK